MLDDLARQQPHASARYLITSGVLVNSRQKRFYDSEECTFARKALLKLVKDPSYNTDSSYYDGTSRNFIDRHLYYLSMHPGISLEGYISNLKLMTRNHAKKIVPK